MPTYAYLPLQFGQTRLLELLIDQKELTGVIHVYTIHKELAGTSQNSVQARRQPGPPQYHALSHHWTADKQSCSIAIKHEDNLYDLEVRPSLKEALESIREKIKNKAGWNRFLWVDAICINQRDKTEKGLQLPIMGSIYNLAQSVIVWLGNSTLESKRAILFIERLQKHRELRDCLRKYEHAENWKALAMLTRRPWFQRLWIVQEIAAAKQAIVLVGEDSVLWDDLASALSLFGKQYEQVRQMLMEGGEFSKNSDWLGEIRQSGAYMLVEAKDWVLRKRSDGEVAEHIKTLESLLTTLSAFEVTQPHDVVYAILWLSSDANPQRSRQHGQHYSFRSKSPTPEDIRRSRHPKRALSEDSTDEPAKKHLHDGAGLSNPRNGARSPTLMPPPVGFRSVSRRSSISGQFLQLTTLAVEQRQATDPTRHVGRGITVDYGLTVFDLCKSVLEHIFELTGSLDIICFPWAPPPQPGESSHPSWLLSRRRNKYSRARRDSAPDNQTPRRADADTFVGRPGAGRRPYLACRSTKGRDAKIEDRVLHVAGYSIATVGDAEETALDGVIPAGWLKRLGWLDTSQPPPDRFWRLLVGNKGPSDSGDCPSHFKLACRWAFEAVDDGENMNLQAARDDGDREAVFKDFIERALAVTWNRRLITSQACQHMRGSDSSLYGLGPRTARPGDHICILLGCAVPVLLRPKQAAGPHPWTYRSSGGVYSTSTPEDSALSAIPSLNVNSMEDFEFVGEAYIDGFMSGECMDFVDKHNIRLQDFFIH